MFTQNGEICMFWPVQCSKHDIYLAIGCAIFRSILNTVNTFNGCSLLVLANKQAKTESEQSDSIQPPAVLLFVLAKQYYNIDDGSSYLLARLQ